MRVPYRTEEDVGDAVVQTLQAPVARRLLARGLESLRFRAWMEGVAVAGLVGAAYLLTLARVHAETDDGLFAAEQVRNGAPEGLFVPSHIAYNWLARGAFEVARVLGHEGGPLLPMQMMDATLGAAGVGLLWFFLRRTTSLPVAATACSVLAFSYGYWFYSVSVEVYVLSALLLIVAFIAAFRAVEAPSVRSFGLLGVAGGLAVLGHTTNVLFAVVVMAALAMTLRSRRGPDVARYGVCCLAGAAVVVLPAYGLAIAMLGLESPREVYLWYTEITRTGDWGAWNTSSVPEAIIGGGRALIGGHALFGLDELRHAIEGRFGSQNPREERYLASDMHIGQVVLTGVLAAVVLAGLVASLLGWLRIRALAGNARVIAFLCAAWLVAYVPFFAWWEPLNIEFWIAVWVPASMLVALPQLGLEPRRRRRVQWLASALVLSLFLVNLTGSVLPQRDEGNDYWRARIGWYEENARAGDLILSAGHLWSSYADYFTPAEVLDVFALLARHGGDEGSAVAEIDRRLQGTDEGRVWLSAEVLYPGEYAIVCCADASGGAGIGAVIAERFGSRLQLVERGALEWVWEVRRE